MLILIARSYRSVPELPKDVDDYDEEHVYPHCPAFQEIGKLRGPFDLGLIPIGAYVRKNVLLIPHLNGIQTYQVIFGLSILKT